jgi:hypothetical protein
MKATTLRSLRQWHYLIGVFLAPAILFFAFSGLFQVLGWQDARNPPPAAWVSAIAGIHKHQMLPKPRPTEPAHKPAAARPAIGLFTTTLIGLTIALGTRAMRGKAVIALGLGVAVPVALLVL